MTPETIEIIDRLLPLIGVIIGGFFGFFGNYLINERNYNRSLKRVKEENLENLFNDYCIVLNSYFRNFDDILIKFLSIHNETITDLHRSDLDNHEIIINKEIRSYEIKMDEITSKFDFGTELNINEIVFSVDQLSIELFRFINQLSLPNNNIMIGNDEYKLLVDLRQKMSDEQEKIQEKLRGFYTTKYLPNKQ